MSTKHLKRCFPNLLSTQTQQLSMQPTNFQALKVGKSYPGKKYLVPEEPGEHDGEGESPCMPTSSASGSLQPLMEEPGSWSSSSKQGGEMPRSCCPQLLAPPRRRGVTEIYLRSKAELVKSIEVHSTMMAVLQQGPQQGMPRGLCYLMCCDQHAVTQPC